MNSKICPNCNKVFTKETAFMEYHPKHLIERDWKRRVFCSGICRDHYHSRGVSAKHRLEKIIRLNPNKDCVKCGYNEFEDILEIHHIIKKSNGGTDDDNNLIVLCPNCHVLVHKNHICIGDNNNE